MKTVQFVLIALAALTAQGCVFVSDDESSECDADPFALSADGSAKCSEASALVEASPSPIETPEPEASTSPSPSPSPAASPTPIAISLDSISPSVGPIAGGTTITLIGSGFSEGSSISIGSVSCASPQLVSSTELRCASGTGSAGTAAVTVTRADGESDSIAGAFTYFAPLQISPASKTLAVGNNSTFTATGGISPLSYSIPSGGGSISASNGLYAAPGSSGSATVRVTDSIGNTSDATVSINAALSISPTTARVNIGASRSFAASGGVSPYAYSVTAGSGSVTTGGTYTASSATGSENVRATDSLGNTSDATVSVPRGFLLGGNHTCAIVSGGTLKCWGFNSFNGRLGFGDTTSRNNAATVSGVSLGTGRAAKSGGAGYQHTCAVLDNGNVKCWGDNASGQLGQGDTDNRGDGANEMGDNLTAIDLGTGRTAVAVDGGSAHSCALLDNGNMKCWGSGSSGKLGQGDTSNRGDAASELGDSLPEINLGSGRTVTQFDSGYYHNCAVLDTGAVTCWGFNFYGQIGIGLNAAFSYGDNEAIGTTVSLGTGRTATQVAAGERHSCALLDNGTVKCWGENTNGQLGQGDTDHRGDQASDMGDNLPAISLGTGRTATAIACGKQFTCAVLDNGALKCWGANGYGQLGQGDTTARGDAAGEMGDNLTAIDLGTGRTAISIKAGDDFACAMLDNLDIKCWGRNNTGGELGLGENTNNRGDEASEMGDNLPAVNPGS